MGSRTWSGLGLPGVRRRRRRRLLLQRLRRRARRHRRGGRRPALVLQSTGVNVAAMGGRGRRRVRAGIPAP